MTSTKNLCYNKCFTCKYFYDDIGNCFRRSCVNNHSRNSFQDNYSKDPYSMYVTSSNEDEYNKVVQQTFSPTNQSMGYICPECGKFNPVYNDMSIYRNFVCNYCGANFSI